MIEHLLKFLREEITEHDETRASLQDVYDEVIGLQQRLQKAEALLLQICEWDRMNSTSYWRSEIDKLQIGQQPPVVTNDDGNVRVYVRDGVEVRAYVDRCEVGPMKFLREIV